VEVPAVAVSVRLGVAAARAPRGTPEGNGCACRSSASRRGGTGGTHVHPNVWEARRRRWTLGALELEGALVVEDQNERTSTGSYNLPQPMGELDVGSRRLVSACQRTKGRRRR